MSWQNEVLMERLRAKSGQVMSLADLGRCVRACLQERPQLVDSAGREQLRACLKQLQTRVGVYSVQSSMERVRAVARQLTLHFQRSGPHSCSLESDMFAVSLQFDAVSESVTGALVRHQAAPAPVSSAELAAALAEGDFAEFGEHLKGLQAIYIVQVPAEVRPRLFSVLSAVEQDLLRLSQLSHRSSHTDQLVNESLGLVMPRRGGRAMRITFLVPPRELIDLASGQLEPLQSEKLWRRPLGYWAEVGLTEGPEISLPCQPQVSECGDRPVFAALSSLPCVTVTASPVLRLSRPLPCDEATCRALRRVTALQQPAWQEPVSVLQLVTGSDHLRPLLVALPDQRHRYHVLSDSCVRAVSVCAVPFRHAGQAVRLVRLLRRQALLHALLSSVVRQCDESSDEPEVSLELTVAGSGQLCLTFSHPVTNTLCRLQVTLYRQGNPICACLCTGDGLKEDKALSTILLRSFSLPVTMRALMIRLSRSQLKSVPDVDCVTSSPPVIIKQEPPDHEDTGLSCENNQSPVAPDMESEHSPWDELRNIESTVRQIELDKAQTGQRTNQSLTRNILGFSGGTAPNIPSSLTITPIPHVDKGKERRDKDRSEKRRKRDMSPSSRVHRDSDPNSSPSRLSGKLISKHSTSGKHSSKTALDSPPFKRHPSFSNSPAKSTGTITISSGSTSSKSSSKGAYNQFSSIKYPNSGQPLASVVLESGSDRDSDSLRDQIKSLIAKGEMNELSSSQLLDPQGQMSSQRSSGDSLDSRKGCLTDVISKLNSIVADETGALRDDRKSEFIVKPSTDGIKLTINKTKSRSSSSSPIGMRHSGDTDRASPSPASARKALYRAEDSSDVRFISQDSVSVRSAIPSVGSSDMKHGANTMSGRTLDKRELALDRELPPLPKSLEIKKIGRSVDSSLSGAARFAPQRSNTTITRGCSPTSSSDFLMDKVSLTQSALRCGTPTSSLQMHMVSTPSADVRRCISSPRPSTLPQSSPCLIDDDLMEDPLLALGK